MSKRCKIYAVMLICVIISMLSVGCSGDGKNALSEITSVKYDSETEKIVIEATLSSADVREFRGETVYLIEIPANSSVSDILTLIPISQTKAASEMSFTFPLKNGAKTYLYSGYVLAAFDNVNGYIPLCESRYIENPEVLSKNNEAYPSYSSIKGLSVVSSSEAMSLGVKHTVIRIPVEDYIIPSDSENVITSVFDGISYSYDSKKIGELDYKIKTLSGAGIEVIFEFTLDTAPSALPSALSVLGSYSGEALEGDCHYAISVSNGDSYRYMAAFFEFLAERYTRSDAKYGFAASYIIGRGVNSLEDTGIDDARTLADSVSRYAKLMRVAETALRSKYKNGKIFASLGSTLKLSKEVEQNENNVSDPALPVPHRTLFGAGEFLSALEKEIKAGGAFDYGVAFIPTEADSSVWDTDVSTSEILTAKNLSDARDIADSRELIIYNYEIPSDNESMMAASYAYAYLKAVAAEVYAFVYNGQADGMTGNGSSGLMSIDSSGSVVSKRELYDVFRTVDIIGEPEPGAAKTLIGAEWSTLYSEYGEGIKNVSFGSGNGSTTEDKEDKKLKRADRRAIFDFSEGKSFGFYPSDSSAYVEIADYIGEKALKSGLYPRYIGEKMGVRSAPIAFETLENAMQIEVVLSADGGGGNTTVTELMLCQNSPEGGVVYTSSVSVQSANRQRVYFDISDSGIDEKYGDVTMYLHVVSGVGRSGIYDGAEESEELTLYVESISGAFRKTGSGILLTVILIILALALIGTFLYLYYRRGSGIGAGRYDTYGRGHAQSDFRYPSGQGRGQPRGTMPPRGRPGAAPQSRAQLQRGYGTPMKRNPNAPIQRNSGTSAAGHPESMRYPQRNGAARSAADVGNSRNGSFSDRNGMNRR